MIIERTLIADKMKGLNAWIPNARWWLIFAHEARFQIAATGNSFFWQISNKEHLSMKYSLNKKQLTIIPIYIVKSFWSMIIQVKANSYHNEGSPRLYKRHI